MFERMSATPLFKRYLRLEAAGFKVDWPVVFNTGAIMSDARARTRGEATAMAKESDLVAFFPMPDELLLDLDEVYETAVIKTQARLTNDAAVKVLSRAGAIMMWSHLYTISKSGNAHLYIKTSESLTDQERIVAHLLLGSDPVREAYNLVRLRDSDNSDRPYCMALFETQEQAIVVRKWRLDLSIQRAKARLATVRSAMSLGKYSTHDIT